MGHSYETGIGNCALLTPAWAGDVARKWREGWEDTGDFKERTRG